MKATVTLQKDFTAGEAGAMLYGSFVEHLGRCIYGGIYEPGHPRADARGFRQDVLDIVRELKPPIIRYPGGNYSSSYDWKDSVGPANKRPVRPDLAWRSLEPNSFGLDEFSTWLAAVPAEILMTLNMGTQGLQEALELLEYCNFTGGTYWSDLRRSHGREKPYDIRNWCLGNEIDGPWQVGQKSALEYGRLANETAKAMKLLDPRARICVCGSSFKRMPTFPEWERTVLDACYDNVDLLSLHMYLRNFDKDRTTYLAESLEMEQYIRIALGICDETMDRRKSRKRLDISFDEWNVWPRANEDDRFKDPWRIAPPLLEEMYTLEDALVFGCMMNVLIRNAGRIKIACMSLLVNALSPIMTATGGPAWRQATFYPFLYGCRHGMGTSLMPIMDCSSYENRVHGIVPHLDTSAVLNPAAGEVALFIVNRHQTEDAELRIVADGFGVMKPIEHVILDTKDPMAANTQANPLLVTPRVAGVPSAGADGILVRIPRFSWNLVRVGVGKP
jgi:alpha-L-arabinofuranosidase